MNSWTRLADRAVTLPDLLRLLADQCPGITTLEWRPDDCNLDHYRWASLASDARSECAALLARCPHLRTLRLPVRTDWLHAAIPLKKKRKGRHVAPPPTEDDPPPYFCASPGPLVVYGDPVRGFHDPAGAETGEWRGRVEALYSGWGQHLLAPNVLGSTTLRALPRHYRNLKALHIGQSGCPDLTLDTLVPIVTHCVHLQDLCINACDRFDDACVAAV